MYPAETSLIPATVALIKYFELHGFSAFFNNYPFWYLGSTPYKYLTGPIVPIIISWIHKIASNISLFSIIIYFVIVLLLLSCLGWGLLVKKITKNNVLGLLSAIFYLIFPWKYLSSLAMGGASIIFAKALLPFTLLTYWSVLEKGRVRNKIFAIATTLFLLFVDTNIIAVFLVGIISLVIAYSYKKGKVVDLTNNLKPAVLVFATSLILATLWYGPNYWITILTNPSIGGASGFKVILRILDLLKASVPVIMAVFVVYFSGRIKSKLLVFSMVWTFTFLFLTFFRFIGDPDFWMDWSAWFSEIEVGFSLIASFLLSKIYLKFKNNVSFNSIMLYFVTLILVILPFLVTKTIYGKLNKPNLISQTPPSYINSLAKLSEIAGKSNVFLSGSSVFWADSFYDIRQIRGGRDNVSLNPDWNHGAYVLREGINKIEMTKWLEKLDISYVLVHNNNSSEYYHDFKNVQVWKELGESVWQKKGDVIFKILEN